MLGKVIEERLRRSAVIEIKTAKNYSINIGV